jgi:hypothetical protein
MTQPPQKPEKLKPDHLEFLDSLRENGSVNMFAGALYLQDYDPALDKYDAKDILIYWMQTFTQRHLP